VKRTTVSLPDELAGALEREARRRRVSVSQVTREALAARLGLAGDATAPLPFAALGASGHRTTARDLEEILANEWSRARDR
jgi:Arc/MetJ-type ribon-helix-helix transcriptional regulator